MKKLTKYHLNFDYIDVVQFTEQNGINIVNNNIYPVKGYTNIDIWVKNYIFYYKDIDVTIFIDKYLSYINTLSNNNKEKLLELYLENPEILNDKNLIKVLL